MAVAIAVIVGVALTLRWWAGRPVLDFDFDPEAPEGGPDNQEESK